MTGKIRGILSERRGIALASVMIIFIVAVILVTGITTAITAQANIIKSRENVSQAHYYAYSAVQSVLTALEENDVTLKKDADGTYHVSVAGINPTSGTLSLTTKIYPETTPNKFRLVTTAVYKNDTAVSEVYFDLKDESTGGTPASEILTEFKAPLAFVNAKSINEPAGIVINDNGTKTEKDNLSEVNNDSFAYKLPNASKMPIFSFADGFIASDHYTMGGNATAIEPNINSSTKNVFYNYPKAKTVNIDVKNKLDNIFIYAPIATNINFNGNGTGSGAHFNDVIIFAPNAAVNFSSNKYEVTNGFINSKSVNINGLAQMLSYKGLIVASDTFKMEGTNNSELIITGALITSNLDLIYTSNNEKYPTTFNTLSTTDNIDNYLHGFFNYKTSGTSIIVDSGTGGGSSVKYVIDPTSIVYKK